MGVVMLAGTVSPKALDLAAGRVFYALMRTGQLDSQGRASPYTKIPKSVVNDAKARALVLEAARQSIVLLQNKPPTGTADTTATAAGKEEVAGAGSKDRAESAPLLPLKLGSSSIKSIVFLGAQSGTL